MDGRIFHLKAQIAHNLSYKWTVEKMAATIELSVPHFQKLFKANVGIPPMTFVHDLRLERARELFETTFHQVKQIGNQTGLTNDSHLTRDFKKKYGIAPIEYRKSHWERIQSEKATDTENRISLENVFVVPEIMVE